MPERRPPSDPPPDPPPPMLAGGNPQIAKGDGDGPVQAYIAAMPEWKRAVGEYLDDLIGRTVPDVRKAVKYNEPFYGGVHDGWFASFRCFTTYVKLTFFRGSSLEPPPPVAFKQPDPRALHIHEGDPIDESLLVSWIRQASNLPGKVI